MNSTCMRLGTTIKYPVLSKGTAVWQSFALENKPIHREYGTESDGWATEKKIHLLLTDE